MAYDQWELKKQLRRHERYRSLAYADSVGKMTVGYGHNLEAKGLHPEIAELLLRYGIQQAYIGARMHDDRWTGAGLTSQEEKFLGAEFKRIYGWYLRLDETPWKKGDDAVLGAGYNLSKAPMPMHIAERQLDLDIQDAEKGVRELFPDFDNLDDPRQRVLVNMSFNMGSGGKDKQGRMVGGLAGFKGFLGAVQAKDFEKAAEEMLLVHAGGDPSPWALQVQYRALELALMMAVGATWRGNRAPTADDFPDALQGTVRKVEVAIAKQKTEREEKQRAAEAAKQHALNPQQAEAGGNADIQDFEFKSLGTP